MLPHVGPRNPLQGAVFAAFLVLSGCGDPAPAGPPSRDPLHLVVAGTDREMGLAHGKALAAAIREEVGPRLRARLSAVATDRADAKFLQDALRLYTAKVKPLLPSGVREELAGIAEGSGVPEDSVLLLEVMREGLRFHLDAPPLLEAALASPPYCETPRTPRGFTTCVGRVVAAWDGADGVDLTGHALLLERRPVGRHATLVVTWPGGLGALAGVSDAHVLVAQGEVPRAREQQTLDGVPFTVALRLALEAADGAVNPSTLPALNANRVLLVDDLGGGPRADRWGHRDLALIARIGGELKAFDENAWVLSPAGPGGKDARVRAMDERLGGYPTRPDSSQTVALAVSGRSSQAGAVIEVTGSGIRWLTGIGADGKPGHSSRDLEFPFGPPRAK